MNKLLLILITLLVAAQSYAQSVKFQFRAKSSSEFPNLNISNIIITSSIPLFKTLRQGKIIEHECGIKFETKDPLFIDAVENTDQIATLMTLLRKIIQSDTLKHRDEDVLLKNRTSYNMGTLVSFVEDIMIKNGFSVTLKDKIGDVAKDKNYNFVWELYFFKP